jgi:hypothetical protein
MGSSTPGDVVLLGILKDWGEMATYWVLDVIFDMVAGLGSVENF